MLGSAISRSKVVATALIAASAIVAAGVWQTPGSIDAADACAPTRPHATGDFNETLDSGGLTRDYLLHVPKSYSGADAVPLVLNLHHGTGTAQAQADVSQFPAKADQEGFLVVMPQASGMSNRFWNYTTMLSGYPDDVGFIADLLDYLSQELCVDVQRVYATGLSSGAMMSVRLGCSLSERIAAIAPVAGVYFPPRAPEDQEPAGCPSVGPVPITAFHGVDDPVLPYLGGTALFGQTMRSIPDEIMPDWGAHNDCDPTPDETQITTHVLRVRYENCDGGVGVELYAVEGDGHTWPGSGSATQEISATGLIWDFFVLHQGSGAKTVGGVAELPEADNAGSLETSGSSSISTGLLVGIVAGGVALAGAVAWYARRRLSG